MNSVLSLLSGAVLVVLVYGLSFFPLATLAQLDEVEDPMSRADEESTSPDAEDAEAPSDALRGWAGRENGTS